MKRTIDQRFWDKVDTSGDCWLWQGSTNHRGYGLFKGKLRVVPAHRWSYEQYIAAVPSELYVLHRCDVRACVRPDHLFVGTQADNMRDAMNKDRVCYGSRHPRAKLTEPDVVAIRNLFGLMSVTAIAKQF